MPDFSAAISRLTVTAIPLLLGIILHELAHAVAARACGDPTAARMGRITLNPIAHIDPTGLVFFVLTALTSPFVFGWAKPVIINPHNFRKLTRDTMIVAFAGPLSNFIMAFVFTFLLWLFVTTLPSTISMFFGHHEFIAKVLYAGIQINFVLAWFNLMPIPPLDGSKILWGVLPAEIATKYMRLERYGFIIIMLLLFTGAFRFVLWPLVRYSVQFSLSLAQLQ